MTSRYPWAFARFQAVTLIDWSGRVADENFQSLLRGIRNFVLSPPRPPERNSERPPVELPPVEPPLVELPPVEPPPPPPVGRVASGLRPTFHSP